MRTVERHAFNPEATRPLFAGTVEKFASMLRREEPWSFSQVHGAGRRGLEFMEEASVFAREHPMLPLAARTLGQARLGAVLHAVIPRGSPVEFPLGGRRIQMESLGSNGQSDMVAWVQGWYGALIARDMDAQAGLREIPDLALDAASKVDTYHYAWKKALLAVDTDADLTVAEVEQAVRLTDANFITEAMPGVPRVAAAMFPMLAAIARNDSAWFNDCVIDALEAHRDLWGRHSPHGPRSWIAIGPLALCCLARDRGIAVEVESDYLLPVLMRRE